MPYSAFHGKTQWFLNSFNFHGVDELLLLYVFLLLCVFGPAGLVFMRSSQDQFESENDGTPKATFPYNKSDCAWISVDEEATNPMRFQWLWTNKQQIKRSFTNCERTNSQYNVFSLIVRDQTTHPMVFSMILSDHSANPTVCPMILNETKTRQPRGAHWIRLNQSWDPMAFQLFR